MPSNNSNVVKGMVNHVNSRAAGTGLEQVLVHGLRYHVLRKIGEGSFSTILLCQVAAEDANKIKELPGQVAVKRMYVHGDDMSGAHREMDLLEQLKHPHIVRVYTCEAVRAEGVNTVTVTMERCVESVVDRMKALEASNSQFTTSEAMGIFASVASAVGYMHAQNPPVAHRDIKAENVLLSEGGYYRLCDFGSATTNAFLCSSQLDVNRATDDVDKHTTLAYMAPEQADPWRRQRIDEKVDVWALGVLLQYLLTFKLPFEETKLSVLSGRRRHMPASVPQEFVYIVDRCLEPDPAKRWNIFELQAFLAESDAFLRVCGDGKVSLTDLAPPPGQDPQPNIAPTASGSGSRSTLAGPPVSQQTQQQPPAAAGGLFGMLQWEGNAGGGKAPAPPAPAQPVPPAVVSTPQMAPPAVQQSTPVQRQELDLFAATSEPQPSPAAPVQPVPAPLPVQSQPTGAPSTSAPLVDLFGGPMQVQNSSNNTVASPAWGPNAAQEEKPQQPQPQPELDLFSTFGVPQQPPAQPQQQTQGAHSLDAFF